jgi:predicted regulator of Ras-like GTPase activity (Roadblock/LC7/MglB family)
VREKIVRKPERDNMHASGIARVLELFFGGNTKVQAAILFDDTGEAVDYHAYIDPFDARLLAAYNGIIFNKTQYKLKWLEGATVSMIEIMTERMDMVTVPVIEDFFLVVAMEAGALDENILDTIAGSLEALRQEIG